MELNNRVQSGTLKVSEDVIVTITKLAILEIDGVKSLASSSLSLTSIFSKKDTQGNLVKVKLMGDVVEISVGVIVEYGYKVVRIAEQIQNSVKSSVQTMTGVTVAKVNVRIAGVVLEDQQEN